tara:strand:+ start:937 stop:1176 length:240 start_codon:yes stop_codon:yes gene_type:complete
VLINSNLKSNFYRFITFIIFTDKTKKMKNSDYLILGSAFLSFLFSIYLWFSGQNDEGLYVGIWVPSILAAGGYFKQIKK